MEQVRLERLDRSEVGAMVSAIAATDDTQPSSAFVEALHRRTAGVPFVVEELMRVVGPGALVSEVLDAELPWSLEEAVRQQLDGLDDPATGVVEALAVYGRAASFEALLGVTEADESDLLAALRALTSTGVVVEVSDDKFWFSHALVADAIVHQLLDARTPPSPRALLRGRSPRARHSITRRWRTTPRRRTPRRDPGDRPPRRRQYLEKGLTFAALRLADEGLGEAPNDPELLAVATEAAWRLDFLEEALTTAVRWVKVAVEPAERIDALRFLARLHHEQRDETAALAVSPSSSRCGGARRSPAARVAAWSLAQLHMIAGRDREAIAWADEALSDARAVGDQLTEARALVERAGACSVTQPAGRLVADVPRGARGGALLGRLRHLDACDQQRSRPRSVALAGGAPPCAMRCRTSAPASGSTSSVRLRRSPGSCKPPMRRVTCPCCVVWPPKARNGGGGKAAQIVGF